jgi:hypothetical protein
MHSTPSILQARFLRQQRETFTQYGSKAQPIWDAPFRSLREHSPGPHRSYTDFKLSVGFHQNIMTILANI